MARRKGGKAAAFRPPSTTARIPMRGDLGSEIEELEERLRVEQEVDRGENRAPLAPQLARQLLDLQEELRQSEVSFVLRGVGRRAFTDLVGDHPPAADQLEKATELGIQLQWNTDTFPPALVAASVVVPDDWDLEDWAEAYEDWPTGVWARIWRAALAVNNGVVDPGPKSVRASAILATASAQSSTTAPPEASPAASS